MTRLIAVLLSIAAFAAPENKTLLLVEAESDGEMLMALDLRADATKLSAMDNKYLPQLCHWLFSTDGAIGAFRYWPGLKNPGDLISPEQARGMLADSQFQTWAGKDLLSLLEKFEESRRYVHQFNVAQRRIRREKHPEYVSSKHPDRESSETVDPAILDMMRKRFDAFSHSKERFYGVPELKVAYETRGRLFDYIQGRWPIQIVDKSQLYD
jgi:hypothetical protein